MRMLILSAAVSMSLAAPLSAQTVVVPTGLGAVEGNGGSSNLFGQINQSRYQQVYSGTAFGTQSVLLTGLAFRTNGVSTGALFEGEGRAFSRTIGDFMLSLSTTARAPDGLSTAFADNIGSDVSSVIARGSQTFSSAAGSSNGTTRNFDVVFTFDTPFLFDPTSGNLLLDAINFSGGSATSSNGTPFDSQVLSGDAVSSLFRTNGTTGAGTLNTRGFVTQFQFTAAAVPEPATWAMMIAGFGLVGGAVRRRSGSAGPVLA